MSGVLPILRLWGSRVIWLVIAGVVISVVAFVSEGIMIIKKEPEPSTVSSYGPMVQQDPFARFAEIDRPKEPTEPFLVKPYTPSPGEAQRFVFSLKQFEEVVLNYWHQMYRGDLSSYYRGHKIPVWPRVQHAWQKSLLLFLVAIFGGGTAGVLLGGLTIRWRRARALALGISIGGLALPDFFFVMMLQFLTILTVRYWDIRLWSVGVPGGDRYLLLPMIVLSIAPMAYAARLTITAFDEIMRSDYIRTARAKGIAELRVILGHALRNGLPRILNGIPAMANATLSSMVVVELLTSYNNGLAILLVPDGSTPPEVMATAGLILCLWYAVLDGAIQTARVLLTPMLREVRA